MRGQSFKLKQSIPAISRTSEHTSFTNLPEGSIVRIINGPLDGDRILDIDWNGQKMMVFTQDLRERAERIDPPDSPH